MSGDRIATLMFLGLALTLPLSALIVRRLPFGQVARLAAIWTMIIVGTVALVAAGRALFGQDRHDMPRTNIPESHDAHFT